MEKQDFFYNVLANPGFTNTDFKSVGVTDSNSTIRDKDSYLSNPEIVKEFTDAQGNFDNTKFEAAYYHALGKFNQMSQDTYLEDAAASASYTYDNIFAPLEQRRIKSAPSINFQGSPIRPDEQYGYRQYTQGIAGITTTAKTNKSIQEIAQTQKVYDPETNTWEDAPNDSFFANMLDTRVLASWDFDADENGNPTNDEDKIVYRKGEIKLNEDGLPYYENLNGRSIAGKEVLHLSDVLTTDGSVMNSIDFFDSDDLDKSIPGTIMKTAATIAPMLIAPIAPYYIGLGVAFETAKLTNQAIQLGASLLLGESPKWVNSVEGYLAQYELSPSKSSSKSQWNWVNIINLLGDVFKQLAEQRWIGTQGVSWMRKVFQGKNQEELIKAEKLRVLAKYKKQQEELIDNIKITGDLKSVKQLQQLSQISQIEANRAGQKLADAYNKFNANLATIYMTGVTAADSFNEAKVDGLSDRQAALYAIGYSAAEFALLKTDIGQWVLPEAKFDKYKLKTIIEKSAPNIKIDDKIKTQLVNQAIKQTKAKDLITKGFKQALINNRVGKGLANYAIGNALSEGVEETTEELLVDLTKQIYNIGLDLSGSDNRLTAWDNMFDRYTMSFVGGAIGGGLFSLTKDLRNAYSALQDMQRTTAQQELVAYLREGKKDQLIKEIRKTNFNTSALSTDFDIQGDQVFLKAGTKDNNINKDIQDTMVNYVETLDSILKQNGLDISRESIIDQYLPDLRYAALVGSSQLGLYVQDFENKINGALNAAIDYKNMQSTAGRQEAGVTDKSIREAEKQSKEDNKEAEAEDNVLQKRKEDFDNAIKEVNEFKEGKRRRDYILSAIAETNSPLISGFMPVTFRGWIQDKLGKDYSEITEAEYKKYKPIYERYVNNGGYKNDVFQASQALRIMVEQTADNVKEWKHSINIGKTQKVSKVDQRIFETIKQARKEGLTDEIIAAKIMFNIASEIDEEAAERVSEELANSNEAVPQEEYIDTIIEKYAPILRDNIGKAIQVSQQIKQYSIPTRLLLQHLNSYITDDENNLESLQDPYEPMTRSYFSADILDKLSISGLLKNICITLGVKKDVQETIQGLLRSVELDPNSFITQTEQLDEILILVGQIRSMLEAYRQDASLDVIYGYTQVRNELFPELNDKLTSLDQDIINDAQQQLDMLSDNIKSLKNLVEINMGKKLNRQTACGTRILTLLCSKYKSLTGWIDEELDKDSEFLSQQEKAEFEKLKQELNDIEDTSVIEKMSQLDQEKRRDKLFTAIHNFFNNTGIINDISRATKLFNPERIIYKNQCHSTLDEHSTDLDYRSFYWLTATLTAINPHDFFHKYKDIITEEIAPIPLQEYATFMGYASLVNKEVFGKFRDIMINVLTEYNGKDGLKGDIEGFFSEGYLDSGMYPRWLVTMIEGVAGAGKSTAIIGNIVKLLGDNSPFLKKIIIVSSSIENAKKVAKGAGIPEDRCEFYTINTLLQKVSPDYLSKVTTDKNGIQHIDFNNLDIIDPKHTENQAVKKVKCTVTSEPDAASMMIIDEVSLASCTDIDTINDYCTKNNTSLILAGDLVQTSIHGEVVNPETGSVIYLEMFRGYTIGGFASSLSMRPDNNLMEISSTSLRNLVGRSVQTTSPQVSYYLDDNKFKGVAKTSELDDTAMSIIQTMVNDCRKANESLQEGQPKQYIAYIYDQETDPIYEHLKNQYGDVIKGFGGVTFSGITAKYSIINFKNPIAKQKDSGGNDTNEDNFLDTTIKRKLLYTAVTRSVAGSVILNAPININTRIAASFIDTGYNKQAIAKYSKDRKDIYEQVYKDGNQIQLPSNPPNNSPSNPPSNPPSSPSGNSSSNSGNNPPSSSPSNNQGSQEQSGDNNRVLNKTQTFLSKTIDTPDKIYLWSFNKEQLPSINYYIESGNCFGLIGLANLAGFSGQTFSDVYVKIDKDKEEEYFNAFIKTYQGLCSIVTSPNPSNRAEEVKSYLERNIVNEGDIKDVKIGVGIKIYSSDTKNKRNPNFHMIPGQLQNIMVATLFITLKNGESHKVEIPIGSINNYSTYIQQYLATTNDVAMQNAYNSNKDDAVILREKVKQLLINNPNNPYYKNIKLLLDIWIYGRDMYMPISEKNIGDSDFTADYFEKSEKFLTEINSTRQGPLLITEDITSAHKQSLNLAVTDTKYTELRKKNDLVVSDMFMTSEDINDGSDVLIRKGIPFILVSDDVTLNQDELYDLYTKSSVNRKTITLIYLNNPTVSTERYLEYIFYNYSHRGTFDKNIGDITTNIKIAYSFLKVLQDNLDNPDIKSLAEEIYKVGNVATGINSDIEKIKNFLEKYYDLNTGKKKANISHHTIMIDANTKILGNSVKDFSDNIVFKVFKSIITLGRNSNNAPEQAVRTKVLQMLNTIWFPNKVYVSLTSQRAGTSQVLMKVDQLNGQVSVLGEYQDINIGGVVIPSAFGMPYNLVQMAMNQTASYRVTSAKLELDQNKEQDTNLINWYLGNKASNTQKNKAQEYMDNLNRVSKFRIVTIDDSGISTTNISNIKDVINIGNSTTQQEVDTIIANSGFVKIGNDYIQVKQGDDVKSVNITPDFEYNGQQGILISENNNKLLFFNGTQFIRVVDQPRIQQLSDQTPEIKSILDEASTINDEQNLSRLEELLNIVYNIYPNFEKAVKYQLESEAIFGEEYTLQDVVDGSVVKQFITNCIRVYNNKEYESNNNTACSF